jgi:DNA-binding transcriptional LysR family regulator
VELRQINYFLVLAEELHFSEAAFRLGISQPSLSQQIKNLEAEIGLPLFDRIGKKNSLTPAGQLLKKYGTEMTQVLSNLQGELADLREEKTGEIRVAMLPSDLDYRMGELIAKFHETYPEIKLQIIASVEIEQKLIRNEVDFALGIRQEKMEQIIQQDIFTETYDLFVSKRLKKEMPEKITIEEITKLPLILFPSGYYGRELLVEWSKKKDIKLNPIVEISSPMAQFQLVEKDVGVIIQPHQLKSNLNHLEIEEIEIINPPTREVVISYLKDKYLTGPMLAFIEALSYLF